MRSAVDFSIRRVDSGPVRGAARRRQSSQDEQFSLDSEEAPVTPEAPDEQIPPRAEDVPVASPDEDEAGGRLDVTA